MGYPELELLLFVFLLLSVAGNTYLLWRFVLNNNANNKVKDNDIVIDFMRKQGERTKKIQDSKFLQYAQLDKRACSLRIAYLKIEEKALEQNREARDYYINVNKNLAKLLAILAPKSNIEHSKESLAQISQQLKEKAEEFVRRHTSTPLPQQIYDEINSFITQVNTGGLPQAQVKKLTAKILAKIAAFDDVDERVAMKKALLMTDYSNNSLLHMDTMVTNNQSLTMHSEYIHDKLQQHATEGDGSVAKIQTFMEENTKLHQQVEFLRQELQVLKSRPKTQAESEDAVLPLDNLLDISDQIIHTNEQEIKKLRVTVRNQKLAISDLEEMLNSARKNPSNNMDSATEETIKNELEKLSRCLQESETCIEMLEQELDHLKVQLSTQQPASPNQSISDEDLITLKRSLQEVRGELDEKIIRHKRMGAELIFVNEALAAGSIEDLSLLIFQSFTELDCQPNLIIFTKSKTFDMAPSGVLAAKDKILISALRINEVSRDKDTQTLSFRYPNIGGLLRVKLAMDHSQELDSFIALAKLADKFIEKIGQLHANKQHKKHIDSCSNALKQAAHDIDKMCETNFTAVKKSVEASFTQLQSSARAKNVAVGFISTLKTLEQETLEEIASCSNVRLKVRKEFLTLVKRLEDLT